MGALFNTGAVMTAAVIVAGMVGGMVGEAIVGGIVGADILFVTGGLLWETLHTRTCGPNW